MDRKEIDRIPLRNQAIWDADPARATKEALDAISHGGFGEDCIRREVGGYEGQIMAIRRGWVDQKDWHWETNAAGFKAMREHGMEPPIFLPVWDSWHGSRAHYCAFTQEYRGQSALKLFKEAIPKEPSLAMAPLLSREDVVALRDYLNQWLDTAALRPGTVGEK